MAIIMADTAVFGEWVVRFSGRETAVCHFMARSPKSTMLAEVHQVQGRRIEMNQPQSPTRLVLILRWIARLGSFVSLTFLLFFFFGEEMNFYQLATSEIVGLLFFPVGITVGMLLGWRWETLGGTVTVLSLLAFYKVMYAASGRFPDGIWFALFALPGLIFLYCGLSRRHSTHTIRTV